MKVPVIDAHHHFWTYSAAEYGWISDAMAALRRDFLPDDLGREIRAAGVDGVVSVQARQTVAETEWLLSLADRTPFIRGVVGWVPLADPAVEGVLERLARHPKLKAVRHVVQDEPDPDFILRDDINRGVGLLKAHGLVYDILIFERHLPQTLAFVDRHPGQVFVLDHIAKPRIRDGAISPWREQMRELARRPNVWCKLSGVVTEADWARWTPAGIRPYLDAVMEAFGAGRVLWGSDWPVCLVACGYGCWRRTVDDAIAALSASEREGILGGNAIAAYRL
jgi:L-fuconolactonase